MRALIALASWRRWTVASLLSRLPYSMAILAFPLSGLRATGSFATGATLAGVMLVTGGMVALLSGTSFDHREVRRQLQVRCTAASVVMAAMAVAVAVRSPLIVLFGLAAAEGALLGGVPAGFRTLLVVVVPRELLPRAHFFESMMYEAAFLIGPLLVSLVVLQSNVVVAVGLRALILGVAAVALQRLPALGPEPRPRLKRRPPPRRIILLCLLPLPVGTSFGMIESNIPARMPGLGLTTAAAGIFLTCLSAGSCIGGAFVSWHPLRPRRYPYWATGLLAAFALSMLPGAFAPSPRIFGACLLVTSLMLVPLNGLGTAEIERRVKPDRRGQVFGIYLACAQIGGGAGSAANGQLLRVLPAARIPLVAASLLAVLSAVTLGIGVRRHPGGQAGPRLPDPRARLQFDPRIGDGMEDVDDGIDDHIGDPQHQGNA